MSFYYSSSHPSRSDGCRRRAFSNIHYFKDIEGALFHSGIEVQCVRGKHVQGEVKGRFREGRYQPGEYVPLTALFLVYGALCPMGANIL